jgi:hypothetical protein
MGLGRYTAGLSLLIHHTLSSDGSGAAESLRIDSRATVPIIQKLVYLERPDRYRTNRSSGSTARGVTFGHSLLSQNGWLASSCGASSRTGSGRLEADAQTVGPGVREIRIHIAGAHRVFYLATRAEALYVHAFEKKTQKTSARDLRIGRERLRAIGRLTQQNGKEKRG